MKTVRCRLPRRSQVIAEEGLYKKKKALLIGICYADGGGELEGPSELCGPHRDVAAMNQLLIDGYGYDPIDIVILTDEDKPDQVQPTRHNIIEEIKKLVKDANPGDKFFFHYAGHTTQVENGDSSEEDGMDECLIPSDDIGGASIIRDNELRMYLIDALPIGSRMTAVFDSCHSATLLDLPHYRCNRVYTPWLSKGKRRTDSRRNANVRRQAAAVHIYKSKRISTNQVRLKRTSIDTILDSSRNLRMLSINTKSMSISSEYDKWYDTPVSPILRCDSPDPVWPCTGNCLPNKDEDKADVIALASCKDDQVSWEDSDGVSMTQALIKILEIDKHPSLKDMMTLISHYLHHLYLQLHGKTRSYKKEVQKVNRARARKKRSLIEVSSMLEMDNFQDPQLSSHRPLVSSLFGSAPAHHAKQDMNSQWDP